MVYDLQTEFLQASNPYYIFRIKERPCTLLSSTQLAWNCVPRTHLVQQPLQLEQLRLHGGAVLDHVPQGHLVQHHCAFWDVYEHLLRLEKGGSSIAFKMTQRCFSVRRASERAGNRGKETHVQKGRKALKSLL